jgi:long-chain acyl-CoA synthetase
VATDQAQSAEGTGLHTPAGMLRHWAGELPDAPMFVGDEGTVTWAEMYDRARRTGRALLADGIRAGDRVAFLDRNGIEFFEVLFGASLIGAVMVPVNWRLAPTEMAAIIDDSGAPILFFGSDYDGARKEIATALPDVRSWVNIDELHDWRDRMSAGEASDPGFEPTKEEPVIQLYTSGTTGLPKGAVLSALNFVCILEAADEVFDVGPDMVSLVAMPLFHIGGTGWALAALSRGGAAVILRDLLPAALLGAIERHRITHAFLVPAVLNLVLSAPEMADADLTSLRIIFYGASPISDDLLVRSMAGFGCSFAQVYGLTETTGAITTLVPEDHDPDGPRSRLLRSAGRAFSHVELRIVDPETGAELPGGQVGEVWTRSDQNMTGYWHKPEESTAVLMEGGWFRSGDAGWLDEEGYLFLHDRIKDMIVTGGENVYPAEVENALLAHPAVADAAVIGVPSERWGETVKAVVVPVPGAVGSDMSEPELAADIVSATRERLAHYKCPTSVDFVDVLPRNPSGKVLKRELRAPYWQGHDRKIH